MKAPLLVVLLTFSFAFLLGSAVTKRHKKSTYHHGHHHHHHKHVHRLNGTKKKEKKDADGDERKVKTTKKKGKRGRGENRKKRDTIARKKRKGSHHPYYRHSHSNHQQLSFPQVDTDEEELLQYIRSSSPDGIIPEKIQKVIDKYSPLLLDAFKEAKTNFNKSEWLPWITSPETRRDPTVSITTVFSHKDVDHDAPHHSCDIGCFRIPSIVQTSNGTLVAFAEARCNNCSDDAALGIASKRSLDGGETWSALSWAVTPDFGSNTSVPPHPSDPTKKYGIRGNAGGNPTAVYDHQNKRILLHFARGKDLDKKKFLYNFQTFSSDEGKTWSSPTNISKFLGDWSGSLPGPGNGAVQLSAQTKHEGRIVVAAHYGTSMNCYSGSVPCPTGGPNGGVVVFYTDDGGATYKLSNRHQGFLGMDETSISELPGGHVMVNMRNDYRVTHGQCTNNTQNTSTGGSCRAVATSKAGEDWTTDISHQPDLWDPQVDGALATVNNISVFFNPRMQHARNQPTLRFSQDGTDWSSIKPQRIADSYVDYSAIVRGTLQKKPNYGGLLWGSCWAPVPLRLWCIPLETVSGAEVSAWTVLFSPFKIPSPPVSES